MAAARNLLRPDTPFSYTCARCTRCCVNKRVQVNPYEIARIARSLGISTSAARVRYVTADQILRRRDDERCVFLSGADCRVHADRPLVCRMFPHSRMVESDGTQVFREANRDHVAGTFGTDGTVETYLDAQGARPFMIAADAYFAWYLRARDPLAGREEDGGEDSADLLDMDGRITAWCAARDEAEPADMDGRLALHLTILDAYLEKDDHNG